MGVIDAASASNRRTAVPVVVSGVFRPWTGFENGTPIINVGGRSLRTQGLSLLAGPKVRNPPLAEVGTGRSRAARPRSAFGSDANVVVRPKVDVGKGFSHLQLRSRSSAKLDLSLQHFLSGLRFEHRDL